jgi:hypothetical protein
MRVHRIENVNKSLAFLHTKVRNNLLFSSLDPSRWHRGISGLFIDRLGSRLDVRLRVMPDVNLLAFTLLLLHLRD